MARLGKVILRQSGTLDMGKIDVGVTCLIDAGLKKRTNSSTIVWTMCGGIIIIGRR